MVGIGENPQEQHRRAADLHLAGAKYEVIAEQLGYASASGAFYAVKSGLEDAIRDGDAETKKLELDRLDRLLMGLWPKAARGDVGAVDRVLKVMERRARYLGLDATGTQDAPTEESPVTSIAARRAERRRKAQGA